MKHRQRGLRMGDQDQVATAPPRRLRVGPRKSLAIDHRNASLVLIAGHWQQQHFSQAQRGARFAFCVVRGGSVHRSLTLLLNRRRVAADLQTAAPLQLRRPLATEAPGTAVDAGGLLRAPGGSALECTQRVL